MDTLFQLGMYFLNAFSAVGDLLMSTDFGQSLYDRISSWDLLWAVLPGFLKDFLHSLTLEPLGFLIFGGALSFFLLYKLMTFFRRMLP